MLDSAGLVLVLLTLCVLAAVAGENVYVQVSLDGTVRTSGLGIPQWERWMGDLAPLDDVRTKWTKQ